MLLGIGNLCAVATQQLLSFYIVRTQRNLCRTVGVIAIVLSALSAALLFLPLPKLALAVVICGVFTIVGALQPALDSLYRGYHNRGIAINYSRSRGVGSLSFALGALIVGSFLTGVPVRTIPLFYLIPAVMLSVTLFIFNAPNVDGAEQKTATDENSAGKNEKASLFREYPHFVLFLTAVVFLSIPTIFSETYMLQIMQRLDGGITDVGIALFISGFVEFLAMLAYKVFCKKVGNRKLLLIACWMWCLKFTAILPSPTPKVIYAAELLQFAGYVL